MNALRLLLDQALKDALGTRDLECLHAAMRTDRSQWSAAGFDVTIAHASGQGAAVTASAPTLHAALRRAISTFDQHVRPSIETRNPKGPSNEPSRTRGSRPTQGPARSSRARQG